MALIKEHITIESPVERVFGEWADLTQLPQILSSVKEVRMLGGEQSHWTVSIAGKEKEYDAKITAFQPNQLISWESVEGDDTGGNVKFEAVDQATTQITLEVRWAPEGVIEQTGETMGIDDAAVKSDLKKFKDRMEQAG